MSKIRDIKKTKLIGGLFGGLSAIIGLSLAKLMIGSGSMSNSTYTAVVSFVIISFLLGLIAGKLIISEHKNYGVVGILMALFSVWIAVILGVAIDVFVSKSFFTIFSFRFLEQIFIGILLFTLYGGIPILIIGFLYGLVLKYFRQK